MKFNWGYGILVVIFLFMTFILSLVYKCSKQRIDLVSEKYYEMELDYQKKIDELNNASSNKEKLSVQFHQDQNVIEIRYPVNQPKESISGIIHFYKPDNASLDLTVAVRCAAGNGQMVPVETLQRGWWKVEVNWSSNGTSYSGEKKLLIN